MKEPKNTNELYKYIVKYLSYRHRITEYKFAHVADTSIIRVSPKGCVKYGDARYVLERRIYLDEAENKFMTLSYKEFSGKKWRIPINEYERSA